MLNTRSNYSTDIHQTTSHHFKGRIGSGSSCDVFEGFEKNSGKRRAIKLLKDRSWDRELMKEAESLMKIKRHPNIIEFYGKEKDLLTGQSCLIIEFCSGGSLHSYLKEVENLHGLQDAEFSILLDHITSGLDHLRQHNCIHRDIKPGNILRHVTSDKRTIYKLSDFGASRIMKNCEEEFMSLAGTEEYLHPAMYEKAFVNRKSNATFNHSADLWSLGCTLYQAATGLMPFVPFDGARNNRITMYEMVACKPHGAISGSQTSSDSPISWDFTLPNNCNMTRSFQGYILRILVGLLEANSFKQWTFVFYKNTVSRILKLKRLVVLNCDDKNVHEIYLNPTSSVVELEEEIARVTDIPASNQKLYFHQHRLDVFLEGKQQIEHFPRTSLKDPIILISQIVDTNTELDITLDPYPTFHTESTIATDITTATSQCEMIHTVLKKMQVQTCIIAGLHMATLTMWQITQYKHYRVEKKYQPWFEIYRQIRFLLRTTGDIFRGYMTNGFKGVLQEMNAFQNQFYDRLKYIKTRIESTGHEKLSFKLSDESENDWLKLTTVLFERSQELLHRIQGRKKCILNDYESCIHQADKIEMQELTARCIDYWQTSCAEDRKKAALLYSSNKKLYITVMKNMVEIERDLIDLEELRNQCQLKYSEILTKLLGPSSNELRIKGNMAASKSVMHAQPECKSAEYSVKASKSSPLPRSPIKEILEENKAYSFKIEDSITHAPVPYTVELGDIGYVPQKQSPMNQSPGRQSPERPSPQESPWRQSPEPTSPEKKSSSKQSANLTSSEKESSGKQSPKITSSEQESSGKQSPKITSTEKESSGKQSPKLTSSEQESSGKQSPKLTSSEQESSGKQSPMLTSSEQESSGRESPKNNKPERQLSHASNSQRTHIDLSALSHSSNDSGVGTLHLNEKVLKDWEVDAPILEERTSLLDSLNS